MLIKIYFMEIKYHKLIYIVKSIIIAKKNKISLFDEIKHITQNNINSHLNNSDNAMTKT